MPAVQRPSEPRPAPKVGFVSLGCPKALVDSERIITKLRSEGYQIAPDYQGADVVIVNTCGFLDSAKQESLEAIGEALAENGRVIVTGCLGVEEELIRKTHPNEPDLRHGSRLALHGMGALRRKRRARARGAR